MTRPRVLLALPAALLLPACSPDLSVVLDDSGLPQTTVDAAVKRFIGEHQLTVERSMRSEDTLQIHLEGDPDGREMVPLGDALDRIIAAQPATTRIMLHVTDDDPQEVPLRFDPTAGHAGLYTLTQGFAPSHHNLELCAWSIAPDNLPPMAMSFEPRDDLPPELRESASGLADTFNSIRMGRPREFRLDGEPFETGAVRIEFEPDQVLFVFEETPTSSMPTQFGLGAPPAKFRACMKTIMRRASEPFIANVMFPILSTTVRGYSTP